MIHRAVDDNSRAGGGSHSNASEVFAYNIILCNLRLLRQLVNVGQH